MRLLTIGVLLSIGVPQSVPPPNVPRGNFEVRISIEPSSGLPGIPPTTRIEVQNLANEPARFPIYAKLRVEWRDSESDATETFVADDDDGWWKYGVPLEKEPDQFDRDAAVTFKAKERRTYTIWTGPVTPWWSVYPRLERPGKYAVQVIIPGPGYESNKVPYEVLKPTGADAAAWQVIKSDNSRSAEVIWERYPNSQYAPYYMPASESGLDQTERIAALERSIKMELPGRWIDERRVGLAQALNARGYHLAVRARDYEGANAAYDRARELLEYVIRNGVARQDRELAQQTLRQTYSQDTVAALRDEANGIYPDHIYPMAECVQTLPGGKKLLWWSYNNITNAGRSIAVGMNNKLTPAPHDRGQPTLFESAYHPRVFSTPVGDEQSFTWHLYKDSVHITRAEIEKLKQCIWPDP